MRSYRVTPIDIVRAILNTETGLKPVRCVLFTLLVLFSLSSCQDVARIQALARRTPYVNVIVNDAKFMDLQRCSDE